MLRRTAFKNYHPPPFEPTSSCAPILEATDPSSIVLPSVPANKSTITFSPSSACHLLRLGTFFGLAPSSVGHLLCLLYLLRPRHLPYCLNSTLRRTSTPLSANNRRNQRNVPLFQGRGHPEHRRSQPRFLLLPPSSSRASNAGPKLISTETNGARYATPGHFASLALW